jgi:hypothetical protein
METRTRLPHPRGCNALVDKPQQTLILLIQVSEEMGGGGALPTGKILQDGLNGMRRGNIARVPLGKNTLPSKDTGVSVKGHLLDCP